VRRSVVRSEKGIEHRVKRQKVEDRERRKEFRIADCETGNPPAGWESEGQFKIVGPVIAPADRAFP
jgi:hypothetical protein